jgi:hypothetical protein
MGFESFEAALVLVTEATLEAFEQHEGAGLAGGGYGVNERGFDAGFRLEFPLQLGEEFDETRHGLGGEDDRFSQFGIARGILDRAASGLK